MKTLYSFILSTVAFLFFSQQAYTQDNYKIIDSDLKGKIEYDNAKKTDAAKRVDIFYLYEVNISNVIEDKEKIQSIMGDFSVEHKLEKNYFDYEKKSLYLIARYNLSDESIKVIFDKYDYQVVNIKETFGLKD